MLNADDLEDSMTATCADWQSKLNTLGIAPNDLTNRGVAALIELQKQTMRMILEAFTANADQTDIIANDANEMSNVESQIATVGEQVEAVDTYVHEKLEAP